MASRRARPECLGGLFDSDDSDNKICQTEIQSKLSLLSDRDLVDQQLVLGLTPLLEQQTTPSLPMQTGEVGELARFNSHPSAVLMTEKIRLFKSLIHKWEMSREEDSPFFYLEEYTTGQNSSDHVVCFDLDGDEVLLQTPANYPKDQVTERRPSI